MPPQSTCENAPNLASILTRIFEAKIQNSPISASAIVLCGSIATPSPILAFGDTVVEGDMILGNIKHLSFKNLAYFFLSLLLSIATKAQQYSFLNFSASSHLPIIPSPVTLSSQKLILLNTRKLSAISFTFLPKLKD